MTIDSKGVATVILFTSFLACDKTPTPSPTSPATQKSAPSFVGKVWTATDNSAPRGTMRIFLDDGSLLMDSCWETYRLARWKSIDGERIEWDEDGARIEAAVLEATADTLRLRLQLKSETKDEAYRIAQTPFVCPDMPR